MPRAIVGPMQRWAGAPRIALLRRLRALETGSDVAPVRVPKITKRGASQKYEPLRFLVTSELPSYYFVN